MLTQEDLKLLETLFDRKLEPLKQDIAGIKEEMKPLKRGMTEMQGDIAEIKGDLAEIKENAEITRDATNYLLDLVEGKEKAIRKLM